MRRHSLGVAHPSNPLAVTRKNLRAAAAAVLDFFDRCAFLALLHPPLAGTPTALQFATGNPYYAAKPLAESPDSSGGGGGLGVDRGAGNPQMGVPD